MYCNRNLSKAAGQVNALNMQVNQTGLYRITYEKLRDAGLDLNGVRPTSIKVTLAGKAVPIYVLTTEGRFGPGNYIEFHGRALDTIYTRHQRVHHPSQPGQIPVHRC